MVAQEFSPFALAIFVDRLNSKSETDIELSKGYMMYI